MAKIIDKNGYHARRFSRLVGKDIRMIKKKSPHYDKETKELIGYYIKDLECYPWADCFEPVPMRVLAEYPNYILVKVLPHINDSEPGRGPSKEYVQTISKFDIDNGVFTIFEGDLNDSFNNLNAYMPCTDV